MNIALALYRLSRNPKFQHIRGFWRYSAWTNRLVFDRYFKIPYFEGHAWLCPAHAMGINVFFNGAYEPVVIQLIREFVGKGYSFIDVGANLGLHTLAAGFLRTSEKQYFYAFEPEEGLFSMLKKNCSSNNLSFVKCFQDAIGDKQGSLILNLSTDKNKGRNSLIPAQGLVPGKEVNITTLDVLFDKDPYINLPVLVKVDVEGYEANVIQGGRRWLSNVKDASIICEITPELRATPRKYKQLMNNFKSTGFVNSWIINDPDTIEQDSTVFSQSINVLFIKGKLSGKIFSNLNKSIFLKEGIDDKT